MEIRIGVDSRDRSRAGRRALAAQLRAYLMGCISAARVDLEQHRIPPLYELATAGRVVYRESPTRHLFEDFCLPSVVLARGYGDCDQLCQWRCAELQNAGERALPLIYWRESTDVLHVQVRRADGTVEDPSRLLGM